MLRPLAATCLAILIALGSGAVRADALGDGLEAYRTGDYEASRTALLPVARAGNTQAQFYLGLMAYHGRGMAVDRAAAAEWYRKAAGQDHRQAQFNLGLMLATGRGVPVDLEEALRLITEAAEGGEPMAQYRLAFMYGVGEGAEKDLAQSVRWNRRAAEQGEPRAQYSLGFQYAKGMGVERDLVESVKWLYLSSQRYREGTSRDRVIQLRDAVSRLVTRDQYDEALRRAKAWSPKPETDDEMPIMAEDGTAESAPFEPVRQATAALEPVPSEPVREAAADPSETPAAPASHPPGREPPTEPAETRAAAPQHTVPSGPRIQVGAYRSKEMAMAQWRRLLSAHEVVLGDLRPIIERIDLGARRGVFYRLQAGPFASLVEAGGACDRLKARNLDCRVRDR